MHPNAPMTGVVVHSGNVATVTTSVPFDRSLVLSDLELIMFSYRGSVQCLALIDIIFSLLALFSGETGAFISLITLIGPVLGYYGAGNLHKGCVVVYLAFCIVKTVIQIVLMFTYSNFWYILFAIIQIWITKVVWTFSRALNTISADRLTVLRKPGFLQAALQQNNAVVATRYF